MSGIRRRKGDIAPNPELWAALGEGPGLLQILTDFYSRVFEDPRLAPFFVGTTQQRAIEKQYSFLRDVFSGTREYFGDRPRNAHHWMVISDELFDYRELLMKRCLEAYGLPEKHLRAWLSAEETFRKQIVKDTPIPKRVRGVDLPLDGYESLVLSVGGLCDACAGEIPRHTEATYHVRTGRTFCPACSPNNLGLAGVPASPAGDAPVHSYLEEGHE